MLKTMLAVFFAFSSLFIAQSIAQQITGNLEGRVLDERNEPLVSVNVVLRSPQHARRTWNSFRQEGLLSCFSPFSGSLHGNFETYRIPRHDT